MAHDPSERHLTCRRVVRFPDGTIGMQLDSFARRPLWEFLSEARLALSEALALAEKNDERFHEAELHRLQGELVLAESDDQAVAEENERWGKARTITASRFDSAITTLTAPARASSGC